MGSIGSIRLLSRAKRSGVEGSAFRLPRMGVALPHLLENSPSASRDQALAWRTSRLFRTRSHFREFLTQRKLSLMKNSANHDTLALNPVEDNVLSLLNASQTRMERVARPAPTRRLRNKVEAIRPVR